MSSPIFIKRENSIFRMDERTDILSFATTNIQSTSRIKARDFELYTRPNRARPRGAAMVPGAHCEYSCAYIEVTFLVKKILYIRDFSKIAFSNP